MNITEFVTARLDEWERAARNATPGRWKLWGMSVMADQDGTSNVDTAVDVAHTVMLIDGKPRTFDARHIAMHDPTATLALVAALRAVIDGHEDRRSQVLDTTTITGGPWTTVVLSEWCPRCMHPSPCPTLRRIASIWADHADYDAGWTA